jgi:malate dehydrogenase (oxaloacetate-decarboxylating)
MSKSTELHEKLEGKIEVSGKMKIKTREDLSLLYTPGVAEVSAEIAKDRTLAYKYTMKKNTVAIVTDGTRVLGLGDIGPEAALPVMEGKAMIMSQFGGINAMPLCLGTKNEDEIVRICEAIAPNFGAINLEDIETPKVFRIQKRLEQSLPIPVFHDDREGTAIVALAGLINAMKHLGLGKDAKTAMVGAGSAGYGIVKLLKLYGFTDLTCFDRDGAIYPGREMEEYKKELAELTNPAFKGKLEDFEGVQILIAASSPGSVPEKAVRAMKKPCVLFSLANPNPEITYDKSKELGVTVYGSGRSDTINQINNSLCFPGFLRALLTLNIRKITPQMHIAAAEAIAKCVKEPAPEKIVPETFEPRLKKAIERGIKKVM